MSQDKIQLYGVIGNPISGSKSPWIHNHVFDTCDIAGAYLALDVAAEQLPKTVSNLKALGVSGFSVTIPHKTEIISYLDELDPVAKAVGAVNTVVCKSGRWLGYNTDGPGLMAVLNRHIPELKNKKVLILGAGGASRGICGSLVELGVKKLGIWNRTSEKAIQLANEFKSFVGECSQVMPVSSETYFSEYDVVINATSVGMEPNIEGSPVEIAHLKPQAVVCDIVYKPHQTRLIKEALKNGHPVIFGIEMLIEQALLAQQLWNELTEDVLDESRKALIGALNT